MSARLEKLQPLPAKLSSRSQEFSAQLQVTGSNATRSDIDHNVEMIRDFAAGFPENLPKESLDPVAHHGAAYLSRNRNPQTVMPGLVLPPKQHKPLGRYLTACFVKHPVVRGLDNANFVRK